VAYFQAANGLKSPKLGQTSFSVSIRTITEDKKGAQKAPFFLFPMGAIEIFKNPRRKR
jgi:hypothetical protein